MVIKNDGDVSIEDGNLIIGTSGHGIDFSNVSTSASGSDSAVLNDYEIGTWTPVPKVGTSNIQTSGSASKGTYVKIGRVVFFWGTVNQTRGSTTGTFKIEGLPFNTGSLTSGGPDSGNILIRPNDNVIWNGSYSAQCGSTDIFFYSNPTGISGSSLGNLSGETFLGTAATNFIITGHYTTA
jgi:hypothetical protein